MAGDNRDKNSSVEACLNSDPECNYNWTLSAVSILKL